MAKKICFDWIYLDCDGTFINLYGVENWLDFLKDENPYPYEVAKPLVNLSVMAKTLHKLQTKGYKIGIISWLAKNSSKEYEAKVTAAKLKWLSKHLPSVIFDSIDIIPYGTPKTTCGIGILFDDEEKNRNDWEEKSGLAFCEKELLKNLQNLLKV